MIIGLLRGPVGRLILLAVLLLAIQTTVLVELRVVGVSIQVLLAFSAAVGVVGGFDAAVVAGFVCGIVYDLGTGSPLGLSAITMGLAGLTASTVNALNLEPHWSINAMFVGLGAAVGEAANPIVRSFIGESGVVSGRLLVVVPIVALAAALMSPVLIPAGRWAMRIEKPTWRLPGAAT